MPTIPESTTIPYETFLANILEGNYQHHFNIDLYKFLSSFLSDCNIPCFLNRLIEEGTLKNVWNFCKDYISSKHHRIPENAIQKLLEFKYNLIRLFSEKDSDVNYTLTQNDSNTINSYFSFVEEVLQTPNFTTVKFGDYTGKNATLDSVVMLTAIINRTDNDYDIFNPLNNFIKGLGKLVLSLKNKAESYDFLILHVKKLIDEAETSQKIKLAELSSLRCNFLSQYHEVAGIITACQQIFNTTDCCPDPLSTATSPSTSLSPSTEIVKGDLFISFGLGALAGSLDGLSETLLHILDRKSCSSNTIRLVAVVFALSNSLAIATLPLIYSVIQQLDNDQDSSIQSEAVTRLAFAFLTALILQSIKTGIHYFSNYLGDKPRLKFLIGFFPLLTCFWMIANGEDSVTEGLALASTSLAGAIVSKSMMMGCANKFIFFPVKQEALANSYTDGCNSDENSTPVEIAVREYNATVIRTYPPYTGDYYKF